MTAGANGIIPFPPICWKVDSQRSCAGSRPCLAHRLGAAPAVCILGWLALVSVPSVPGPIRPGLDPGWMTGLHMAAAQGLVAGRDLVWTYGPLGWLALPVATSEHFTPMLAYRLVLWAVWVGAMGLLALRTLPLALVAYAIAAASLTANSAFTYFLPDAQLGVAVLAVGLLVLSSVGPPLRDNENFAAISKICPYGGRQPRLDRLDQPPAPVDLCPPWLFRARYICLAVLAALAGLATVVKFNVALEGIAVFAGTASVVGWNDRRWERPARVRLCVVACVLPTSSLLCYTLAAGTAEGYFAYIANTVEISAGYSEGMSYPGPSLLVWLALAAAAVVLVLIPASSKAKWPLLRGWIPAAASCFLAFKHGVVRGDIHMLPILLNYSLAASYLLVAAANGSDRKRIIYAQTGMTALGLWMVLAVAPRGGAHLIDRIALDPAAAIASAIFDHASARAELAAGNRAVQERLSADSPLAALDKDRTVEVVPYETTYVWANNGRWKPRPLFQTYQVCTPAHDRLNAEHLASRRAADSVLFHWDPIDGRHPLFVDPLSWRTTLDRYEFLARDDRFLALRRRPEPRFGRPREVATTTAAWGQTVNVPASAEPLLLAAEISRSVLGNLANLFYRVNPVRIEITDQHHSVTCWRFIRPNIAHGILVNPFPANLDELTELAGPKFALDRRAVTVRFSADSPGQFAPRFTIRWSNLPLLDRYSGIAGGLPRSLD